VQFAALAHDPGHPPFGDNGEHALDRKMKIDSGFEGNAQSLRILAVTERKLVPTPTGGSTEFGLNLTLRSLASVLKYDHRIAPDRPAATNPCKGYYACDSEIVTKIKEAVAPGYSGEFKTIECSIWMSRTTSHTLLMTSKIHFMPDL
jgi:dGTPase